jgi:Flp pilus assembly pilin Flp
MPKLLCSALRYDAGATAIEYALIASFVSLVIITAWALLEDPIVENFQLVASQL